jgi:hypothetical protein
VVDTPVFRVFVTSPRLLHPADLAESEKLELKRLDFID